MTILVGLAWLSTAAFIQDDKPVGFYETAQQWVVAGDREVGGCVATLKNAAPTRFSVLSQPSQAAMTFALLNPAWRSLRDEASTRVTAHFYAGSALTDSWDLDAISYNKAGASPVINFTIDKAANDGASFIDQFSAADRVEFVKNKVPVAAFNLAGSAWAMQRLMACRQYLRTGPNFDPFDQ